MLKDYLFQWLELAPPRNFEEWCKSRKHLQPQPMETSKLLIKIEDKPTRKPPNEITANETIVELGQKKEQIRLIVNDPIIKNGNLDFFKMEDSKKTPEEMDFSASHFNYLRINNGEIFKITGAVIEFLEINSQSLKELILDNCCIGQIYFHANSISSVLIKNAWIGTLDLRLNSIINLRIEEGWICSINCPATYEDNPFRGSVDFEKVKLPTSKKNSILFQGAQQYRNLRAHFEKLQNGPMSGLMRAKELASERESDKGFSKLFNWIYYIISSYGRNPGKAFIWFWVFLLLNFAFLYSFDGGVISPNQNTPEQIMKLQDNSLSQTSLRVIRLISDGIFNPAGIFRTNKPINFKTYWGPFYTLGFILMADASLIFFGLSIRKRLKFS